MDLQEQTYKNLKTLKNEQVSFFLSNKNFCSNTYNYLNLPTLIDFDNGNEIHYTYTANGTKIRKQVFTETVLTSSRYYLGAFEYNLNGLEFIHTDEGRIVPYEVTVPPNEGTITKYRYEYFLKDHLGNVRVAFTDDGQGTALELSEDSYYPFGMTMGGLSYVSSNLASQNYKYNGKEEQNEHGYLMSDYGFRHYDKRLGRWFVVDPMAEIYYSWSPYVYALNNPVRFIDPDGQAPQEPPTNQSYSLMNNTRTEKVMKLITLTTSIENQTTEIILNNYYGDNDVSIDEKINVTKEISKNINCKINDKNSLEMNINGELSGSSDNIKDNIKNGAKDVAVWGAGEAVGQVVKTVVGSVASTIVGVVLNTVSPVKLGKGDTKNSLYKSMSSSAIQKAINNEKVMNKIYKLMEKETEKYNDQEERL
ncbi:MAG: RHS repeat-associated core domain-containing protein [Bacteroidales bacterium]|nr:RHS repeat-associated core domain-containing protein [Bacteroidales bacterium]